MHLLGASGGDEIEVTWMCATASVTGTHQCCENQLSTRVQDLLVLLCIYMYVWKCETSHWNVMLLGWRQAGCGGCRHTTATLGLGYIECGIIAVAAWLPKGVCLCTFGMKCSDDVDAVVMTAVGLKCGVKRLSRKTLSNLFSFLVGNM